VSIEEPQTIWPEAFWLEAITSGTLPLTQCNDCGSVHFYPLMVCRACGSTSLSSKQSAGKGTVYSATQSFQPGSPIISIIELDEGLRILAHLEEKILEIGTRVELASIDTNAAPKVIFKAAL
jgi:uncharacterized protein